MARGEAGEGATGPRVGGEAPRVTLVGLRHRDAAAGRRLERLLGTRRPSVIVLEASRASIAYRRGPGALWRREIEALLAASDPSSERAREARDLLSMLALPVEVRAALRHARWARPRPRLLLAERSAPCVPLLEEIDLWAAEVADRLRRGEEPPFRPRASPLLPPTEDERREAISRERRLARVVRREARSAARGGVLLAGGIDHLAPLARLLADLEPETRALSPIAPCAT